MTAALPTPSYRDMLAKQDWPSLRKSLKLWAWKATGSRSMERAEDLAHDAISRLWEDAGVRWDPRTEPSLFRFLTGLVRGSLANERRVKRTRSEVLAGEKTIEAHADDARNASDEVLIRRERFLRIFGALSDRVAHDPVGAEIAELFAAGVDEAAEQAKASGRSIEEIRRGRRRVFDHAAAIEREMGEVA